LLEDGPGLLQGAAVEFGVEAVVIPELRKLPELVY
jgi:hypothetical protein